MKPWQFELTYSTRQGEQTETPIMHARDLATAWKKVAKYGYVGTPTEWVLMGVRYIGS